MHWTTHLIIGVVGAANMLLILRLAQIFHIDSKHLVRSVTSFFIPERVKSRAIPAVLHVVAGVGFATAYAYLFKWVGTAGFSEFASEGALIGFVHGFFVCVFFAAAISDEEVPLFHAPAAALSVAAHIVFGGTVGLGLAFAESAGTAVWFAIFDLAVLGLLAAVDAMVRGERRPHAESDGNGRIPAVHGL